MTHPRASRAAAAALMLLATAPFGPAQARDIRVCTVSWAPFYGPDLPRKGFITAITRAAFEAVGHDPRFEFMPWARAMLEVEQGDRDMLMGLYRTAERAETYVYTERIHPTTNVVIAREELGLARFDSLRDLEGYSIGFGRGWSFGEAFDNAGFLDKRPTNDQRLSLRKLFAGRLDMVVSSFGRFRYLAKQEGFDLDRTVVLEPPLTKDFLYNAFSPKLENADALVADFNRGLEAIRADGTFDRILEEMGYARDGRAAGD